VYNRVPPLYKVKIGLRSTTSRRTRRLEVCFLRASASRASRSPLATGEALKLTEAKWGRISSALQQYEGYYARLRSDFSAAAAELMVVHRLVEHENQRRPMTFRPQSTRSRRQRLRALDRRQGRRGAAGPRDRDRDLRRAQRAVPIELLGSPIVHKMLRQGVQPPGRDRRAAAVSTVKFGKEIEIAESFRRAPRAGARRGEAGHPGVRAFKGARRDERRAALGDDDGIPRSAC